MRTELDRTWSLDAAEGGIAGGFLFLVLEMAANTAGYGAGGIFRPLRMIAALVLGSRALDSSYSLATAVIVGAVTHVILSVGFALLFIGLAQPWVLRTPRTVLVLALAYGPLLWIINVYVIAPVAGCAWFPQQSNPMIQGVAHTLYGWRLGMALKWPTPYGHDEPAPEQFPRDA